MSRFLDVGARDEKEGVALGKGSASWVEDASADASIASAGASGTTPTAVDASAAVGATIAPAVCMRTGIPQHPNNNTNKCDT